MRLSTLQKELGAKLYFTSGDTADVLGITPESGRVLCSRYVRNGLFLRLKRDFYILKQNWGKLTREELMNVSNFLQVPSYVSFTTALSFYGVTTQVQRDFYESACLRRTGRLDIEGIIFNFYKVDNLYYFDFIKRNDMFIATKEKAFIDSVYLVSLGKYLLDIDALDLGKLDKKRIIKITNSFPEKTGRLVRKICRI